MTDMRERCGFRLWKRRYGLPDSAEHWEEWRRLRQSIREAYCKDADTVFCELMEPTEGMLRAAFDIGLVPANDAVPCWQSMLQHILNESRSASIPHRGTVNEQDTAR